jgi:hypothetical protein
MPTCSRLPATSRIPTRRLARSRGLVLTLVLGLVGLLLAGCGVKAGKVPEHKIFADDGQKLETERAISFAVIGNTRDARGFSDRRAHHRAVHGGATREIVADLANEVMDRSLSFVVHMGDGVTASTGPAWRAEDATFKNVFDGATVGKSGAKRIPVMPVAGDGEYRRDRLLKGLGLAFPGVGADIGFNRVASWYAYDLKVKKARWRILVLDTNKRALGPRWQEQLYWIPKAVEGDDYDSLIVFMHHPTETLASHEQANYEGAPSELLDIVEDSIGLMKLRAVFTGDPHTTEVFEIGGRYGTLHVNAGGGGAPASDLFRWNVVQEGEDQDNLVESLKLEPIFDISAMKAFNKRAVDDRFPESIMDAGRGDGSYAGFPAFFDARWFPLYGYWVVRLDGSTMNVTWRLWTSDGKLSDAYQVDYRNETGWQTGG